MIITHHSLSRTMRILLTILTASAVSGFMPTSTPKHTTALNNVGSKWAYDPYGATHQENFFYRPDPTSDPSVGEVWYFQPWGFVTQPQFFPLEKTGLDMWYFEPRSVVPADDEFFHGYNSASHMWISDPASAPASVAAPPVLAATEQGAIPPAVQQQQIMPQPVQQTMPAQQMDSTMSAYDKAMTGN
jgi:hypothetical protein